MTDSAEQLSTLSVSSLKEIKIEHSLCEVKSCPPLCINIATVMQTLNSSYLHSIHDWVS